MSASRKIKGNIQAGILALGCVLSVTGAGAEDLKGPQVLIHSQILLAAGDDQGAVGATPSEADLLAQEAELLKKVEENRGGSRAEPANDIQPEAAAASPAGGDAVAVNADTPSEGQRVEKLSLPNPTEADSIVAEQPVEPVAKKGKSAGSAPGSDVQARLDRAQQKINGLVAELDQTRNRLMLAETEVERLNAIIEDRNRSKLESYSSNAASGAAQQRARRNSIKPEALPNPGGKITDDMPIATVVVDKAHLRTGPGLNNSPLMTVSQGTRLAVETRMGDWYRIISPTGTRAWVASDVVAFGLEGKPDPSRTTKVKGYDSRLEDKGFDLTRKLDESEE